MDTFTTLWNRLLTRCPSIGPQLSQQFINDSWHTLQARREWSFRRRHVTFAPPTLYQDGSASSNVASGNPTLITGTGTAWTPAMIGRQIRLGGLLYPYYTIVGWLSATSILIDQPWAGADVTNQAYQILQCYYPVPDDFGYFYVATSIKDSYRLWLNLTQADLAILDPQRTNYGQTYAVVFRDYSPTYGGVIGPVIPVTSPTDPVPISTTSTGFTFVANATYIVQVVTGGVSGTATFQWMRAGQTAFQPAIPTSTDAVDLMDGVMLYWPDGLTYVAGDLFVINCISQMTAGVPRYELWPSPTFANYLYPALYIAKESDLSAAQPSLPPFIANRGEVLIELALEKAAEFPGQDMDHPNMYHDLRQAAWHRGKAADMIIDLERNDEEIGVTNIDYQGYPFAPGPWQDGSYRQSHGPWI